MATAPPSRQNFRARAGAAPLKRMFWTAGGGVPIIFPRPRGRGPVEAFIPVAYFVGVGRFPRPRGRGPVEATLDSAAASRALIFPRPRGRGPVEAMTPGT